VVYQIKAKNGRYYMFERTEEGTKLLSHSAEPFHKIPFMLRWDHGISSKSKRPIRKDQKDEKGH